MMDQKTPSTAAGSRPSFVNSNSPTSIKDNLLKWCAYKTRGYAVYYQIIKFNPSKI